MKNLLSKRTLNKYSRQIILKDVGIIGQKKFLIQKYWWLEQVVWEVQ